LNGDATQAIKDSTSGDLKGVGHDIGKHLAQRLGVPFEPVLYSSIGGLLDSGKTSAWDVAFIGAQRSGISPRRIWESNSDIWSRQTHRLRRSQTWTSPA
jgi:hypothetical protein